MDKMTDRELLELAAKGRGYRVHGWVGGRLYVVDPKHPAEHFDPFVWNPLESDGDALRLAVDLGIRIEQARGYAVTNAGATVMHKQFTVQHDGFADTDKHAATRRAIVLAAAEIGREK